MVSKMILQLSLLLHFIFLLLITASSFPSYPISKPGCPDRCGDLLIPFPFGVGSECSLSPKFEITCNTSTSNTSPKASLSYVSPQYIEVVEINQSQIRVRLPVVLNLACYNESGSRITGSADGSGGYGFGDRSYTFSEENWLTMIGCNNMVSIFSGYRPESPEDKQIPGSSCVSYCSNTTNYSDGVGFCPVNDTGVPPSKGCCVTTLRRGMNSVIVQLNDLSTTWPSTRKNFSCSYAFLREKVSSSESNFSYPLSYLSNPDQFVDDEWNWKIREPPILRLDWRISRQNSCSLAQQNATAYECQSNSTCVDFDKGVGGYLCNCSKGYEGNPYLEPGCQDIDECADSTINPCDSNAVCTNTVGNATCSCKRGYNGDGMKDGEGCNRKPQSKMIIIGLGVAVGLILFIALCFILHKVMHKRRKMKNKERMFEHLLLQHQRNEGTLERTKLFSTKVLAKATDNFNESRILGQGGQGTVYKGMLADGMIVAIKKLKLGDDNQLDQLINEVVILSQINHRNVVKLFGCCLGSKVPMLVYEFVPNGTLFDLIHDRNVRIPLTWNFRLKMATDIAGALAYLHSASSIPIYHRDIKSSNILLDEKFVVKVCDFGTSKTFAVDQTHLTTLVRGTFGYLDPEYFESSQFTDKSDVYSFGVVLAELLTGQTPISFEITEGERNLASRFLKTMATNDLSTILDVRVREECGNREAIGVATLAVRCLNPKGKMRPTMREVATELESIRISQMSSAVKEEDQELGVYANKPVMISAIEYTWPSSKSEISSASYTHPLMSE